MNEIDWQSWSDEIHAWAVEKGWWQSERNFGEMMMLVVSEAAEALEEWRLPDMDTSLVYYVKADGSKTEVPIDGMTSKPEGFPIEIADVAIRVLDVLAYLGVDIQHEIGQMNSAAGWTMFENRMPSNVGMQLLAVSYYAANACMIPYMRTAFLVTILVQCQDIAAHHNFNLDQMIRLKMQYNGTRSHRHGNKRA